MHRGQRHVHRVELVVADRTDRRPVGARDYADDAKRLIPDAHFRADGIRAGAEHALVRDGAEHDDLLTPLRFALREKAPVREHPGPPDARQIRLVSRAAG